MEEQRGNGLLWALVGCGALLFVGLCVALGVGAYLVMRDGVPGPTDPVVQPAYPPPQVPPPPPDQPGPSFVLEADVTQVTGTLAGRVNGTCRFEVETQTGADRLHCRTQVFCDSQLVYGGPTAGYFPCQADAVRRSVRGVDGDTTSSDRDGAMTIDTDARTLVVRDDATGALGEFTLTATIR